MKRFISLEIQPPAKSRDHLLLVSTLRILIIYMIQQCIDANGPKATPSEVKIIGYATIRVKYGSRCGRTNFNTFNIC